MTEYEEEDSIDFDKFYSSVYPLFPFDNASNWFGNKMMKLGWQEKEKLTELIQKCYKT